MSAARRPLPPSLYADTARPAVATPPLAADTRAEAVVVGGGFTGLSTALHLAERGRDVVLLEANEPGWGASGRNGGQVNPGLKHHPDEVLRDFGAGLGARMVALSGAAPDLVFDLIRRHQIRCEAHQGGTIRAAYHAKGLAEIGSTAAQYADHGAPVETLTAARMAELTGTGRYLGGLIDRRGGNVNPLGYARGLADAAQRAGARLHGGTTARRIERVEDGWRVETPCGSVRTDRVVLATNGYTDDLWPDLRRSIVPVVSAIAATAPLPDALARAVMPCRSVLFEVADITVYYRVDQSNRLLMGGRGPGREISAPHAFRHLIRYARRLWPALADVAWRHHWSGWLALTPDHYPHLHEPAPGVIAALGYNGRGVAMATAMGREIAARLAGAAADELSMPVTDLRPIPFHGLARTAVAARVAYGRIRDRLGL